MNHVKQEVEGTDDWHYKRFLEGNEESFEALVLKYKNNLIYFIHRYVRDLNQAEDLAQDVFVEILVHKERYHMQTNFKTYLFTIGRNKAVDYIRKNRHQILVEEIPESIEEENVLEAYILKEEEKQVLWDSIKKLKKEYQAALFIIDFEKMSYEEAAKVLHKNMPQMKILIYRARKSLKKVLEKGGYRYEDR